MAQGTLDGWFKKQKTEPVADVSLTEQKQGQCDTEADAEGTLAPTPMAIDEPTQGSGSSDTHMQDSVAEATIAATSSDTAAVAQSLKSAVFAVVGASDSPEVRLLLGAGVTVLDEYSALMCTHLLCEDAESSEARQALADGVMVVGRLWVREACRGCSGEPAAAAATPAPSAEAPAEYRIPAEYCLPDDYVDAWDREHVRAAPSPPHRIAPSPPRSAGAARCRRRAVPPLAPPPPPRPHRLPAPRLLAPSLHRLASLAWQVRLPCSSRCTTAAGTGEPLWPVLCRALHPPPASSRALLGAMREVRAAVGGRWRLEGLKEFLETDLLEAEDGGAGWWSTTLPWLCDIALRLPALFARPLPLLLRGRPGTVALSEEQCACLLAHAFFCSLPHRSTEQPPSAHNSRGLELPYFSCAYLHGALQPPRTAGSKLSATQARTRRPHARTPPARTPHAATPPRHTSHAARPSPQGLEIQVQKWRCLFHYYERIARRQPAAAHAAATPPADAPAAAAAAADAATAADADADANADDDDDDDDDDADAYADAGARRVAFTRVVLDTSELEVGAGGFWRGAEAALCEVHAEAVGAIEEATGTPPYSYIGRAVCSLCTQACLLNKTHCVLTVLTVCSLCACSLCAHGVRTVCARCAHGVLTVCAGMLQLDFANKPIGGGVLRNGCVQEEIRLLICPELIISRVLLETLADNEALLASGFERVSRYSGYASSFRFEGAFEEGTVAAAASRLLAIDARRFGRYERATQYEAHNLERELNKAYAGFSAPDLPLDPPPDPPPAPPPNPPPLAPPPSLPVCTGNWGCGAFGGDVQLKAVVQLLAASAAGRPALRYLTFGDAGLAEGLSRVCAALRARGITVGQLSTLLLDFVPASWPPQPDATAGNVADLFGYLLEAAGADGADGNAPTDAACDEDEDATDVDEEEGQ